MIPRVQFGLIENNSGEAIVDFLLSPGVSDDVTLSCLRHTRALDGKGLIPVPTANSKRLTATANRLILAPDERPVQVDLVRLDRTVPAAGCVGSRDPCPSTSTQRATAQIPKAVGVR